MIVNITNIFSVLYLTTSKLPKMKNILLLLALVSASFSNAQTTFKVIPKPANDFDIVLIPFGVDHSIKVGVLDKSGEASLNIAADMSNVSESVRKEYSSKISETLGFCDKMLPEISEKEDIGTIDPGPYFLYEKGRDSIGTPQGFIILVSDTALFQWVTNPDKGAPVLGTSYDIIYVGENFKYKGRCSEIFSDESDDSETEYRIDLQLKPGWNYIAYTIESIRPATGDISAFPDRVSVTSIQSLPKDVKWMAYYY